MAEQQRAKSEIEAALTIAAARPRDEKRGLDRILTACQRVGLAAKAEYQYSRGGTDITGPSIDLMEVVAQHWCNLEFGFRELARYPGAGGQPGESVVEAFAWDLETNVRRRTQFTVAHSEKTKKGLRVMNDPRDIYEWIANQAQRRVRTCLENLIPRDIVEAAIDQCHETLKAHDPVTPEKVKRMLEWFAEHGVSKEAVEARIQRRIESITPAQMQSMRRIVKSISDGLSAPEDWFATGPAEAPKSPMDQAKDALRTRKPAPAPPQEPGQAAQREREPGEDDEPLEDDLADIKRDWWAELSGCSMLKEVEAVKARAAELPEEQRAVLLNLCAKRAGQIRGKRGQRSNGGELFNGNKEG